MTVHIQCRLRTYRRMWGLNQEELAQLLGRRGGNQVSRLEHGERVPTLEVALACEILFGVIPGEMFPQVYETMEERLMRRLKAFGDQVQTEHGAEADRKREFLELCLGRAVEGIQH